MSSTDDQQQPQPPSIMDVRPGKKKKVRKDPENKKRIENQVKFDLETTESQHKFTQPNEPYESQNEQAAMVQPEQKQPAAKNPRKKKQSMASFELQKGYISNNQQDNENPIEMLPAPSGRNRPKRDHSLASMDFQSKQRGAKNAERSNVSEVTKMTNDDERRKKLDILNHFSDQDNGTLGMNSSYDITPTK